MTLSRLSASALLAIVCAMLMSPWTMRSAAADPRIGAADIDAYVVPVDDAGLRELGLRLGMDNHDILSVERRGNGYQAVIALHREDLTMLDRRGFAPRLWRHPDSGLSYARHSWMAQEEEEGYEVWRSFDEEGGIRDELNGLAAEHPEIVEKVVLGQSHQGRDIIALRVTADAQGSPQGSRPAVFFNAMQHAREWIAVEVNRRLLRHMIDNYGQDDEITELLDTTELWFVVVANPDGYEHTFTEGNRLWRKNLRDNDGDGEITGEDGVDPNRNFASRWNYDSAGSSGNNRSTTYRGPGPASEPMVQVAQDLMQRIDFSFVVNYHSAAKLILWPEGWQDETRTADDAIYRALAGDFFNPAIEGFEPILSAGLYITNGETCDYAHAMADTLCYTPELSTPPPGSEPNGSSGFEFPDDEELIQEEFVRNLPFAMDIAKSATDPTAPQSHLGNTVEPAYVDTFSYSYGSPQSVEVNIQRALGDVTMHYRINDGEPQSSTTTEWQGGERYGDTGDVHYRWVRGVVTGTAVGDMVSVWFEAGDVSTEPFTYEQVAVGDEARVLLVAAEDYTGAGPEYDEAQPRYLDLYTAALDEAGYGHEVYDFDARGRTAPHHLGVLSHFDAVLWYTGDDQGIRDADMPEGTVSREQLDFMLHMRSYLNEGGKLLHAGQYAGLPYARGLEYDPVADDLCDPSSGADGCETLKYDFQRYYLGTWNYEEAVGIDEAEIVGQAAPFAGVRIALAGPAEDEPRADHGVAYSLTSEFMPPEDYPLFEAEPSAVWEGGGFKPYAGNGVLYSGESRYEYQRFGRTIDLSQASEEATLDFAVLRQTRQPFDAFIIEARTVGEEDWTTLPDANGHTTQTDALSCWSSVWYELFPQLVHYMTPDGDSPSGCMAEGTTGAWHAATGFSEGWEAWSIDLSDYVGGEVEIQIAYISSRVAYDGVYLDELGVAADGESLSYRGFEPGEDLDGWQASGLPANGEEPEIDFSVAGADIFPPIQGNAIAATDDSIVMGFGLEAVADEAQRSQILRRSLEHLGVGSTIYLPYVLRAHDGG